MHSEKVMWQILHLSSLCKFLNIILRHSSLIIHVKADEMEMLKGADCGQIFFFVSFWIVYYSSLLHLLKVIYPLFLYVVS